MIEFVFTLDYEIYGDGTGSLKELIYEPGELLFQIFRKWNASCVVFVEAAELEKIHNERSDSAIDLVTSQIREVYRQGFEIGLHLHPQWYKGRIENGAWRLDGSEYNLCLLPPERIRHMVGRSIDYLRNVLDMPRFSPFSFRAGNWLFQPTQPTADILAEHGIRIDSSVFKGGVLHKHGIDYRPALKNGYYWKFKSRVDSHDREGKLLEIPIYTQMVPTWKILTSKRMAIQKKSQAVAGSQNAGFNVKDALRFKYPRKLDFCRMTRSELVETLSKVIDEDIAEPSVYRPVVSIGHTKDLTDINTVDFLLRFLNEKGIGITTLEGAYDKCRLP